MTKNQAELLCTRRQGRLCSAAEWREACRGRAHWSLPHSAKRSASRVCQLASAAGFSSSLVDAGAAKRCRSPKGVFDMVGNAGEWVAGGRVLGGDASTPRSKGHCDAEASVPEGYRDRLVGFRCCYDR